MRAPGDPVAPRGRSLKICKPFRDESQINPPNFSPYCQAVFAPIFLKEILVLGRSHQIDDQLSTFSGLLVQFRAYMTRTCSGCRRTAGRIVRATLKNNLRPWGIRGVSLQKFTWPLKVMDRKNPPNFSPKSFSRYWLSVAFPLSPVGRNKFDAYSLVAENTINGVLLLMKILPENSTPQQATV